MKNDSQMTSIRENWTEITGTIRDVTEVPGQPGMVLVTVAVSETKEVAGYADLLSGLTGTIAGIIMPVETARTARCAGGRRMRARVRRGRLPGDIFAHTKSVVCE